MVWCGNDSYCCGTNNDCCTSDQAFSLKPTLVAIGSNSNSTSSSTATVTATVTESVEGGSDGTGASSKKNVAIGVGVGVPLGVLSVVMLGAGYLWGRNITRARYEAVQQALPEGQMHAFEANSKPIYEVSEALPELPGSGRGSA